MATSVQMCSETQTFIISLPLRVEVISLDFWGTGPHAGRRASVQAMGFTGKPKVTRRRDKESSALNPENSLIGINWNV